MSLPTVLEKMCTGPTRRRAGKLSRWLRRVVVAIPLMAIVGLVGVNLLLMAPIVKDRANRAVSKVLGATTEIGRITWSPWAGVRVRNVRVVALKEAAAIKDVPFFESDTAWVKVNILPLFRGMLDVEEVGLDSPRIACVRGSDGRFLLPFKGSLATGGILPNVGATTEANEESEGVLDKGTDPEESTVEEPDPTPSHGSETKGADRSVQTAPPAKAKRSLDVRLGDVVIRGGSVTLWGATGGEGLGELRDFEMRLNLEGGQTGSFQASGATILGQIEFSGIGGSVRATSGRLEFRDIVANWPDGRIVGSADLRVTSPGTPFVVDLKTEGLKPSQFIKPTESATDEVKSMLDSEIVAHLDLEGYARAIHTVAGALRFEGLKIPVASVLASASLNAGVNDPTETLEFEIAKIVFQLSNGGIVLSDVNFNADRVVARAAGRVSASGVLNVAVRTYVPASAVSSIGAFMKGWPHTRLMHFTALEHTNYIYRDLQVQGTVSEPAIDAWNDGTFFTIPALIDELRELREAGTPSELISTSSSIDAEQEGSSSVPGLDAPTHHDDG